MTKEEFLAMLNDQEVKKELDRLLSDAIKQHLEEVKKSVVVAVKAAISRGQS